jgi:PAS domain S-box-containing protein
MLESLTLANWAAICTILAALLGMSSKVRKYIILAWRHTFGHTSYVLKQHIESEENQLNRIEAELHPNGGNSIRDVLNAIAIRQYEFDAFLRAQLNIHSVAIVRTDISGKLTQVNRAYQAFTGLSPEEALGDGWINAIADEDRGRVIKLWETAVSGGREFHETVIFERNNIKTEAMCNVYRELDSQGHLRGYLGVILPEQDAPCKYADKCHV